MSVTPIEAKSLSSLTALASNPPSYPRNPTHGKHEPLILYIARVPGSRDVFLSPMKPRERVVTAEDIQTSLYFVHVDSPEDAELVRNAQSFQESDTSHLPPSQSKQAHGPLPSIPRKAVPNMPAAAPQRKPVPGILAPANGFESRQNVAAAHYSTSNPNYLSPDTQRSSLDSIQRRIGNERPPPPPRGHSEGGYSWGTSLTVIRRDPSSGAQWNVAHIEDPPTLDVSSLAPNSTRTKRPPGSPLYIDITNPGYSKFIHYGVEDTLRPPSRDPELSSASPISAYGPDGGSSRTSEERAMDRPKIFRRRLWMEGAKDLSGGFGHRRFQSHESNMSAGSPRSNIGESQRSSLDARPSYLSGENQSCSSIQVSDKSTSFRGYVFVSPWNGRCEFSTSAGGGSLKCRHIVPGLQGNPPISLPVSELRFNLPASTKASSSRASTPKVEETKRSSFFRPRHSRQSSSVSDNPSDGMQDTWSSFERLDLSLGQEYAGGGFGGKESKLGKLIIEDEGLKMVDLLVAANVALWWRAYERYETRIKTNR